MVRVANQDRSFGLRFVTSLVAVYLATLIKSGSETSRRLKAVTAEQIIDETALYYGACPLCRRWTGETIASLSQTFGLAHPDSASNLNRRVKQRLRKSKDYRQVAEVAVTTMHQWKVFFAASKWRRFTGTNMKRTNKRHAVARIFCARFLNRRQQREQRANDRKLCPRISLLLLRPPVQIARAFSVLAF